MIFSSHGPTPNYNGNFNLNCHAAYLFQFTHRRLWFTGSFTISRLHRSNVILFSKILHHDLDGLTQRPCRYVIGWTNNSHRISDVSSRQRLRSANRHQLMVPRHRRSTFGRRAGTLFHTHSVTLLGVPTASDRRWKLFFCDAKGRLAHQRNCVMRYTNRLLLLLQLWNPYTTCINNILRLTSVIKFQINIGLSPLFIASMPTNSQK